MLVEDTRSEERGRIQVRESGLRMMHLPHTRVNKGKKKGRDVATAVLLEQRPEDGVWKLVHRHAVPISTPQLASCPYPVWGGTISVRSSWLSSGSLAS